MTKREFYVFIANFIDIMVTVLMLALVKDVLTGTIFDLIIDGTTVIAIIAIENIMKFAIKLNEDIED